MASINSWATKAAHRIVINCGHQCSMSAERVAAIISTYAEPLMILLRGSKRDHSVECAIVEDRPCTCGADAWNARIDATLGCSASLPRKRRVLKAIPGPLPRKGRKPR